MSATSKPDGSTWGRDFYVLLALSAALTLLLAYSVASEYGASWRRIQSEYAALVSEQGGVAPAGWRIEQ